MIRITKAGLHSSIQDSGRVGYLSNGVPVSGPMDKTSAGIANLILGNPVEFATVEITASPFSFECIGNCRIVLSGAICDIEVEGKIYHNHQSIDLKAGMNVTVLAPKVGVRSYLAFAGGVVHDKVLDSSSLYQGVTSASKLCNGDILATIRKSKQIPHSTSVKPQLVHVQSTWIEAYKGPEFDLLDVDQTALEKQYEIGSNDRMAYTLESSFVHSEASILSSCVQPGTVQLTPAGQMSVLMRDAQATGGYPRILQLTELSIDTLAQKRKGDRVELHLISEC